MQILSKVELQNFEQFGIFHRERASLECHWQKYEKANSQKGTQKQFELKVPGWITTSRLPLILVFLMTKDNKLDSYMRRNQILGAIEKRMKGQKLK